MPRNPYYHGPPSDHFDGLRFFNPGQPATDRSLTQVLRWRLAAHSAKWPQAVPVTQARPAYRVDGLRLTAIGHNTVLIQAAGLNLLTDPVWSERASPVTFLGPRRATRPGVDFDRLPPIDAVLITHNHYDHLDLPTLGRLEATFHPLMIMPLGNDAIVRRAVPDARIVTADWHETVALAAHATATLTPANHWSARSTNDRRMALWCGYHIATPAGTVWCAGDTGYGDGALFKRIADRHGAPDVAVIPIGAYEPRWFMAAQHVNPAEAVQIFRDVDARHGLGVHWGTFQLTDEPRDEPPALLAAALQSAGIPSDRFPAALPGSVCDVGTT